MADGTFMDADDAEEQVSGGQGNKHCPGAPDPPITNVSPSPSGGGNGSGAANNNDTATTTEQVDYQEKKKTEANANERRQENHAGRPEREASANQRTKRTVRIYFSTFNRYVCMQSITETKTEQAGVFGKVFGGKDGTWTGKTGACAPSKGMLLHGAERCRSVHSADDQRFEIATIKDSDNTILDNIKYDDDKQPKTRNHFQLRVRCFRHHGAKGNVATKNPTLLPNTNRGGARTPAGYMREI